MLICIGGGMRDSLIQLAQVSHVLSKKQELYGKRLTSQARLS